MKKFNRRFHGFEKGLHRCVNGYEVLKKLVRET
jgi:hypothetical protein